MPPKPPHTPALGTALRALRTTAAMTLQDVAGAAGCGAAYLSRAETGLVKPKPEWVHGVAAAIGQRILDNELAARAIDAKVRAIYEEAGTTPPPRKRTA